ncbi:MAG: hypothetical protein KBC11_01810 [Candidatus Pacebacteria bacterium]|nr:hypothetical protein [Candidatus Paceibacterota bacterium]
MFNNLIQKKFDLMGWGTAYVPPKPIFNSSVKNALHCVLTELSLIAEGKRVSTDFPVAIQKFENYLDLVDKILPDHLERTLNNLDSSSFRVEAACRIACSFELFIIGSSKDSQQEQVLRGLIYPGLKSWINKPKKDESVEVFFGEILIFNLMLSDRLARLTFLSP